VRLSRAVRLSSISMWIRRTVHIYDLTVLMQTTWSYCLCQSWPHENPNLWINGSLELNTKAGAEFGRRVRGINQQILTTARVSEFSHGVECDPDRLHQKSLRPYRRSRPKSPSLEDDRSAFIGTRSWVVLNVIHDRKFRPVAQSVSRWRNQEQPL
jgi:hypothetical protein